MDLWRCGHAGVTYVILGGVEQKLVTPPHTRLPFAYWLEPPVAQNVDEDVYTHKNEQEVTTKI